MSAAKRAATVVALLGVLGVVAGLAFASSGPPTPAISSHPASFTTSTSASFSFTDSASKVTFVCSLDGASYSACTPPKTYGGLASGAHTFRVEAKDGSGHTSDPASYSWTIDLGPPTVTLSFPSDGSLYSTVFWNAGCSAGAGVCGSASDPSGVASVQVSVKQNATGRYWNGSSFITSTPEVFNAASGTTSWSYSLAPPTPDGSYTVHVRATDNAGNTTASGSYPAATFTSDTTPPPPPTLTQFPPNPSTDATTTFKWTDGDAVSYQCSMENGKFAACTDPITYVADTGNNGTHQFAVEGIDAAGNVSSATSYSWKVNKGSIQGFTIGGNAPSPFYPGAPAVSIPVKLTNSNGVPIHVTSLTASLVTGSLPTGCESAWFQITQSNIAATQTVEVPAGGSVTLPAQGASAPAVQMIDSHTIQDACKGANLTFSYSGSAHS
jgi:hypothetical protein